MKVHELIAKLSELDPELEIYVQADHGQLPERSENLIEGKYWEDEPPYTSEEIDLEAPSKECNCVIIA